MIRYLYGKRVYLSHLISGSSLPRLSDISHYSRLENEEMKDDEERKEFLFNKDSVELKINATNGFNIGEILINKNSLAADIKVTLPVRHCYCVCFSKRKNDPELFNKFKADVCVEVDVDILVAELNVIFKDNFIGSEVIAKDVRYYDAYDCLIDVTDKERVFHKPVKFKHEDETRVAIFYPDKKRGWQGDGKIVPFRLPNESLHIDIKVVASDMKSQCVKEVCYREQLL